MCVAASSLYKRELPKTSGIPLARYSIMSAQIPKLHTIDSRVSPLQLCAIIHAYLNCTINIPIRTTTIDSRLSTHYYSIQVSAIRACPILKKVTPTRLGLRRSARIKRARKQPERTQASRVLAANLQGTRVQTPNLQVSYVHAASLHTSHVQASSKHPATYRHRAHRQRAANNLTVRSRRIKLY